MRDCELRQPKHLLLTGAHCVRNDRAEQEHPGGPTAVAWVAGFYEANKSIDFKRVLTHLNYRPSGTGRASLVQQIDAPYPNKTIAWAIPEISSLFNRQTFPVLFPGRI